MKASQSYTSVQKKNANAQLGWFVKNVFTQIMRTITKASWQQMRQKQVSSIICGFGRSTPNTNKYSNLSNLTMPTSKIWCRISNQLMMYIFDIKVRQNLLQTITTSILETKDKYIERVQKFYTKQTKKHQYITEITQTLEKCLNFKKIQTCVRQIFNKQIRHDVFLKKMNTIINDQAHAEKLQKMKKQFEDTEISKGKDMSFDMIYFIKKQKAILKNISELENSIVESEVIVDEAAVGLETIIVQTVEYLKKSSLGLYPLTYDEKQLEDGTYYNGFIYKGYRSLLGLRDYKNGFVYFGEWKNNCRNGWGVYEHRENGYKYAGNWKEDKRNGYGKQITATYTYQGNFMNDRKEGFGSIVQDGVRYDITWKNDKKNGKGKKLDQNGETEVYFLNGVQSLVKGGVATGNAVEGQKRDVNFLAKMFGKNE